MSHFVNHIISTFMFFPLKDDIRLVWFKTYLFVLFLHVNAIYYTLHKYLAIFWGNGHVYLLIYVFETNREVILLVDCRCLNWVIEWGYMYGIRSTRLEEKPLISLYILSYNSFLSLMVCW